MLKKVIVFTTGLILCTISSATNLNKETKAVNADYETTYIPMSTDAFSNWTDDSGEIASSDAKYWGNRSFQALDTFFRGETKEGWEGSLNLKTWKQYTQYIYFTWGGANNIDDSVKLIFHYGDYSETQLNDTFTDNAMVLRYFKIPDAQYSQLDTVNGFDMWIELYDHRGSNFAFHNFGYLHVNQTEEQVGDAMRYYLNNLDTSSDEYAISQRKSIQNHYWYNEYLRPVFYKTYSNIDDSFSSNSDFLNHWYFDHNFFNNQYGTVRHFDKIISSNSYRGEDGANMPFNNDGGFFRGWYDSTDDSGFVASDNLRYRFVSRPFVLSGTGLISVKMAGKASLHVIDVNAPNIEDQPADFAWIDNLARVGNGDEYEDKANIALSKFNNVTMVNHIINLEAYLGKTIQLAICDYDEAVWSAAYFDDLVTYYSNYPSYKVDYTTQTNVNGTYYPSYLDIYVNSKLINNETNPHGVIYNGDNDINKENNNAIVEHNDESVAKEAYDYWTSYITYARQNSLGTDLSSINNTEEMKTIINSVNSLSKPAKEIVFASNDYQRVGATSANWYEIEPTILDLEANIRTLANQNNIIIVEPTGIQIKTNALKTTFDINEQFDYQGLKVELVHSNGQLVELDDSEFIVSNIDTSTGGEKTVIVTYKENTSFTCDYQVYVRTRTGISVDTSSMKTTYKVGETFSASGLKVKAIYDNEDKVDVTDYALSIANDYQFIESDVGDKEVVVTYGSITESFTLTIVENSVVVPVLTSIEVNKEPTKTTYYVDDDYTNYTDGLEIVAHFAGKEDQIVTSECVIGDFSTSEAGTKIISVNYTYEGVTESCEFSLTVLEKELEVITLTSISITTNANKTTFEIGEEFDYSGLVVTATYSDGSSKEVTDYVISTPNMNSLGEQTVTIQYTEDGISKETSYKINVVSAPISITLTSISVTTNANKTAFELGEEFDFSGLVVTATYSDGSTKEVTDYMISTPDMNVLGEQTVTIKYIENGVKKETSYKINIINSNEPVIPENEGLSQGAKIGIIAGSVVGVSGIAALLYFILKKKK